MVISHHNRALTHKIGKWTQIGTFQVQHIQHRWKKQNTKNNALPALLLFRHWFHSSMKKNWSRIHCSLYNCYNYCAAASSPALQNQVFLPEFEYFTFLFKEQIWQKDRETKSKWQWNWKYVPLFNISVIGRNVECAQLNTRCNQTYGNGKRQQWNLNF